MSEPELVMLGFCFIAVVAAVTILLMQWLEARHEYRVQKLEEDSARAELAFRELEDMDDE